MHTTLRHNILSYGFTALLLIGTLLGAVQLTALANPQTAGKRDTRTEVATVASKPIRPAGLKHSIPTRLTISSIGLDASIIPVGLDDSGALQVPAREQAGWYSGSPTPGEVGPAVIDGHVDSIFGPAVFRSLRDVIPGDTITVDRQDGSTITFIAEKTESYAQDAFPTGQVYGDIGYPGLRLITCDGKFNYLTRHYSDNLVVYARVRS